MKRIVTTCPHCFNTIGSETRTSGGRYEVVHHTEFLAELVPEGQARADAQEQTITYHDSCYLARHNDVRSQPRELVDAVGKAIEMPVIASARSAASWRRSDVDGGKAAPPITGARARSGRNGAETLAVACPSAR